MSNALAVAATTAALAYRLSQAMGELDLDGGASPGRPSATADGKPTTKVFLYRVDPTAARRNDDLPTRSGGALVARPRTTLSLHYLLCFTGDEDKAMPDLLLGIAAATVHARPLLTPQEIEAGWALAAPVVGETQDLSGAPDRVRLTVENLSLEDLSHVWSALMGQPYRLSLAVAANVVVLEPDVTPVRPVPVTTRGLHPAVVAAPEITSVMVAGAAAGTPVAVVAGARLEIRGRDLMSDDATVVVLGGVGVPPDGAGSAPPAPSPSSERLVVTLPANTPPGVLGVVVEHRRPMGTPPATRTVRRSGSHAVVVTPSVVRAGTVGTTPGTEPGTYTGVVEVVLARPVPDTRPVVLHLDGAGRSFVFEQPSRTTSGGATTGLSVDVAGVPAGTYLVRVVIGGAASAPHVQTTGPLAGTISGPTVTLP